MTRRTILLWATAVVTVTGLVALLLVGRDGSESAAAPSMAPVASSALPRPASPAPERTVSGPVRVVTLQLNLCNSGFASCYTGGAAVAEAAAVIVANRPDVVTVNEMCRHDVDPLVAAVQKAAPGRRAYGYFQPAYTGGGAPYPCRNGDQFGNAIVGHVPAGEPAPGVRGGKYPMQFDPRIDEQRSWACVHAANRYYACVTHLTANSPAIALAQCRYFTSTAVRTAWAALGGPAPTVLAGDLNLTHPGDPDVAGCVPKGWLRAGDAVQHVLGTTDVRLVETRKVALHKTDHPAWLVTVRTA